jgi:ketosteroid isomerase-like protein
MADTEVITRFYDAFAVRDAETMAACYADNVVFSDPAFGELHGERARDMWRMLCRAGKDLQVRASDIEAADGRGRAHWEADYTFSATKRRVHNVVDAKFVLRDGLIVEHQDTFDFGAWAAQAFGPVGSVLGRTPVLPFVMQRMANRQLDGFQKRAHGTG